MENQIIYTSSTQIVDKKKELSSDASMHVAEINGEKVQVLHDYLNIMSEVFHFPFPSRSLDSYNDWMRDLDWLDKDGYVLIVNNFNSFLSQDLESKKLVVDGFTKIILQFWQEDVMKEVVEGQTKPFIVYLVD